MGVAWRLAPRQEYLEVPVGFLFCESRAAIQEKLSHALDLLASASPQCLKRLRLHVRGILIMPLGTAVGEFFPPLKLCCLDEKHVSKESTLVEEIASTLVHETAHAHLYALGIGYPSSRHVRIEKPVIVGRCGLGRGLAVRLCANARKTISNNRMRFGLPNSRKLVGLTRSSNMRLVVGLRDFLST